MAKAHETSAGKTELTDLQLQLLWDEYKYRHSHCWQTVFRLTVASVSIAIIPYIAPHDLEKVKQFLWVPPVLSLLLILLGMFRIHRELKIFNQVKERFRGWQEAKLHFQFDGVKIGRFKVHLSGYLVSLLLLAIGNLIIYRLST